MNQPSDHEPPVEGAHPESPDARESLGSPAPLAAPEAPVPEAAVPEARPTQPKPSFLFLGIVSVVSLAADLGTKWWALHTLEKPLPNGDGIPAPIEINSWLTFVLARNRGGAWGLLQTANEEIRKPFFLIISVLAIGFIVYLYRKVHPKQHALKWGLPLVLGGAIGNLVDRVRYGWVIDFIDYKATWVRWLNEQISRIWSTHAVTDHWPTFNIADVAICVGVGLMAIDMFTSRAIHREHGAHASPPQDPVKDDSPETLAPAVLPQPSSPPESQEPARSAEQSKV